MKNVPLYSLLACISVMLAVVPAMGRGQAPVLARVEAVDRVDRLGLPVYAHLLDAGGQAYAIVVATEAELEQAGWPFEVLALDPDIAALSIAIERLPGALARGRKQIDVLHDDGCRLIVTPTAEQKAELMDMGLAIIRISTPMVWPSDQAGWSSLRACSAITANPTISNLMHQVYQDTVSNLAAKLSGETPAMIGGEPYTILTRGTSSGTPIQKANQFVYEQMQAAGLEVSYQNWDWSWSNAAYSGQNVVGVKRGATLSNEVVLVTAHIDNMPNDGTRAPGADDNASGCVGVMVAASVLKGCSSERTIRFICFGGEEQGLLGSDAYARSIQDAGETNVTVFNMDMISYSTIASRELSLHTRLATAPGYAADMAVATTFQNVLSTYGLDDRLTLAIQSDGVEWSDHYSFWQKGYPGVLVIECDTNFNPNYHKDSDVLANINMEYFTDFIRASVGTVAHLAGVPAPPATTGPLITANGLTGDVRLNSGDAVAIAIQMMNIEPYLGVEVDWWVVALAGSSWYYLNNSVQWTQEDNWLNWRPVNQGPLFNLPATDVLNTTDLSTGSYTIWFAVDYPMDGILKDGQIIWLDSVNVNIQ